MRQAIKTPTPREAALAHAVFFAVPCAAHRRDKLRAVLVAATLDCRLCALAVAEAAIEACEVRAIA